MRRHAPMRRRRRSVHLTLLLALFLCTVAVPAGPLRAAAAPSDVLGNAPFTSSTSIEQQFVTVQGQPFTQALQVRTTLPPASPYLEEEYRWETTARTDEPIAAGDVLQATFWVRRSDPGDGSEQQAVFLFQNMVSRDVWDYTAFRFGADWKRVQIAFVAGDSATAGNAKVSFWLGYGQRTIQIGGLSILNHGQIRVQDLPEPPSYAGREPNAAWRVAAAQRIEQYRKGDLTVQVQDAGGNPVPGAAVQVTMLRHAFGFGTAVDADMIVADDPDARTHRMMLKRYFNRVAFGSDLKWGEWLDQDRRERYTLPAALWLRDNGFTTRGHVLIWPSWRYIPDSVEALKGNPAALGAAIDARIAETAGQMNRYLDEWDVVNEPYGNHDAIDVLGPDSMAHWFRQARLADPDAQLYLNDYDFFEQDRGWLRHQDYLYATVGDLIVREAPIQGVGMQSHFGWTLTPPEEVLAVLDRFGAFGLDLQITEFDIDITDEQLQADYTRDFLTAIFSHPRMTGFVTWGFWEGRHWLPDGAMFRSDWSLKPNGQAYADLVLNEWWTRAAGVSDATGRYATRGFLGDYEIRVTVNGATETVHATLPRAGATVTVVADGVASAPPVVTEIALNGGFEDDLIAWRDWSGGTALSADAAEGSRSLQISGSGGRYQPLIDLVPGAGYTLRGTARPSAAGEHCFIGVRGGAVAGVSTFTHSMRFTDPGGYAGQSINFPLPADTTWAHLFVWKNAGASGAICTADAISLTPRPGASPATPPVPSVAPTLPPAGENVLVNGGAETGSAGWYCFAPCTATATTSPVRSGAQAILASNRTANWQGLAQNVTSGLSLGPSYHSSAWVRLAPGSAPAIVNLNLKLTTAAGSQTLIFDAQKVTAEGWTQLRGALTPAWTGTLQRAEWYISTDAPSTASFAVDDAELRPGPPPPPGNALFNGGFEADTARWYAFGPTTLAATTNPVRSGVGALLVNGRSAAWQGVAQAVTDRVTSGAAYQSNVWVRLALGGGSATAIVRLKVSTATGSQTFDLGSAVVGEGGWTQISAAATPSWSGAAQRIEWYVATSSGTAGFYLDDAELRPAEQPRAVSPVLECVSKNADGTYTAHFGYYNPNWFVVSLPVGNRNAFHPEPRDRGQTGIFLSGRVRNSFSVTFDGSDLVWILNGRTSTAAKGSKACN